jgi:hypothetical protein
MPFAYFHNCRSQLAKLCPSLPLVRAGFLIEAPLIIHLMLICSHDSLVVDPICTLRGWVRYMMTAILGTNSAFDLSSHYPSPQIVLITWDASSVNLHCDYSIILIVLQTILLSDLVT